MKALTRQQIADQRKEYNQWRPKETKSKSNQHQTVAEWIAQGGVVVIGKPFEVDRLKGSRQCCSNSLESLL